MATQTSVAVVAEKPSVARDIARVLNATKRGEGYIHGDGYVVTWAIGHLVGLAQPHEIRPEWRSWRRDLLPMLPESWPLVPSEQTRDQFEIVRKILTSPRISAVICATDAGREGELIFRYIYEAVGCERPVRRLWISSLTPEAIREGLANVRDWREYDGLADAARGRSRADWLVGMNLSRAYTLACQEELSVGRVQTPTLAMIVDRELAIRNFVPEEYRHVIAQFSPREGQSYEGTWFRPGVEPLDAAMKLPAGGEEAANIAQRVRSGVAQIEKMHAESRRMPPPLFYDLTELQRHANRLYGFSAQRTLELAQSLYERHKLLSYPRTDSRHLSEEIARTLPKIVRAVSPGYEALLAPGTAERPLGRRFVDNAKVTDHHAIIPTGVSPSGVGLDPDEQKIFDLVCRRLLSAWHEDHIWSVTTVITLVRSGAEAVEDRFHSSGSTVQQEGWKVLDVGGGAKERKRPRTNDGASPSTEDQPSLPPYLAEGQPQTVLGAEPVNRKTQAPKRLTDATLLTAMETAGKTLDDKELSDAMKESGLGTPATRAQIIEVLLKRGFIERRGKSLEATAKGIRLIEVVHPEVKSPAMTGQWEAYLKRIERGQAQLGPFMRGIEDFVRNVVGKVGTATTAAPSRPVQPQGGNGASAAAARAMEPRSGESAGSLAEVLRHSFGFPSFLPNQEEVCRVVTTGRDVLLVMPTGSGKSLCYQLPGIVLGGTTLVISPLIALMEDQAAKLNALGLAADRIHSNRDRAALRDVCVRYLNGEVQFLFIAPERLRVRGFPEMLAKRKPSLVAIDEAHCISQWGHDFRPDYRSIGDHLPALRPAPVIALTATATPLVQNDIAAQLGLNAPKHFIHGFRRENIAIEVVKVPPSRRFSLAREILEAAERRPAIIYTPTRRDAESLAGGLASSFAVAPYHAGLDGARREHVQQKFLEGRLEVIVATIAFGMGIDKPDIRTVIHTALPGSVEAYYQEIGRAGRDGAPSRAILMHSYSDRFTHDFFFERDYPDPAILAQIFERLTPEAQPKEVLVRRTGMSSEAFDAALEKLWIHGGVLIDYADNVSRGAPDYQASYVAQREHKMAQFQKMLSWCDVSSCRMLALVNYFGDAADSQRRCGSCDICDPRAAVVQRFRSATAREQRAIAQVLDSLKKSDGVAAGRLYAQLPADAGLERRAFEELLGAMARGGLIEVMDTSFEKDGKVIEFRKVRLTGQGRAGDVSAALFPVEIGTETARARKKKRGTKSLLKRGTSEARPQPATAPSRPADADQIEAALKAWRLAEARKNGIPAFRILTDKALHAIVAKRPQTSAELLAIPGLGLKMVQKYGAQIFHILTRAGQ
jgi:DNA topoisomerase-3